MPSFIQSLSHDSSVAKFLFIEMVGTALLTFVVAMSTYYAWRTVGVVAYGAMYYLLLRGLSVFHLRYTTEPKKNADGTENENSMEVSLTPRFNPALTFAHFFTTSFRYAGDYGKTLLLLIACVASNALGGMIGGTALMKIFKKPGGTALDDVYKYSSSYRTLGSGNSTSLFSSAQKAGGQAGMGAVEAVYAGLRAVSFESMDHLYTEGALVEFVGLCLLAYAFMVDDKRHTHAVDIDKHKTGSTLAKPVAVGAVATLVGYTFADYTGGTCNPAIAWGILMDHDISASYPHLVSSGVALLYILILGVLKWGLQHLTTSMYSKDKSGDDDATWKEWFYENTFFQFGGLFFLTVFVLHSGTDLEGSGKLRPERWTTVGAIFYGFAIAILVWAARHMNFNHDYFHPLANVAVRFVSLLGHAQEKDAKEVTKHGHVIKFVYVILRDAAAVWVGVLYYLYVSPMRDGHPHASHFVALGFASYDSKTFESVVSTSSESDAFTSAAAKGMHWAYLLGPEIAGSAMLVIVTLGATIMDPRVQKMNGLLFGLISGIIVYLFGSITTGTCNAWLSMFSLMVDGHFASEFWSLRVGTIHAAGALTLVLIVAILLFDDMYNERGKPPSYNDTIGEKIVKQFGTANFVTETYSDALVVATRGQGSGVKYSPMTKQSSGAESSFSVAAPSANGGSCGKWDM